MALTFAGTLDRSAVAGAVNRLTDLVGCAEVASAWEGESALPDKLRQTWADEAKARNRRRGGFFS